MAILKTDELNVSQLVKQLQRIAAVNPTAKVLIYDENREKLQDVYRVEKKTVRSSSRALLPTLKSKDLPFLDKGDQIVILTGWSQ